MQIMRNGHVYALPAHAGGPAQSLVFVEKDDAGKVVNDGTTCEEVVSAVIDRLYSLQERRRIREDAIAITKLEEALMWLERRREVARRTGEATSHEHH